MEIKIKLKPHVFKRGVLDTNKLLNTLRKHMKVKKKKCQIYK